MKKPNMIRLEFAEETDGRVIVDWFSTYRGDGVVWGVTGTVYGTTRQEAARAALDDVDHYFESEAELDPPREGG